jgi:hypothetical protein
MDFALSTVSGGTGPRTSVSDDCTASSPSFFGADGMDAVIISFSFALVIPTYKTRISSARISRLRRAAAASRAMVG